LSRLKGRTRWHLLVKARTPKALRAVLAAAAAIDAGRAVRISIDVDPVSPASPCYPADPTAATVLIISNPFAAGSPPWPAGRPASPDEDRWCANESSIAHLDLPPLRTGSLDDAPALGKGARSRLEEELAAAERRLFGARRALVVPLPASSLPDSGLFAMGLD